MLLLYIIVINDFSDIFFYACNQSACSIGHLHMFLQQTNKNIIIVLFHRCFIEPPLFQFSLYILYLTVSNKEILLVCSAFLQSGFTSSLKELFSSRLFQECLKLKCSFFVPILGDFSAKRIALFQNRRTLSRFDITSGSFLRICSRIVISEIITSHSIQCTLIPYSELSLSRSFIFDNVKYYSTGS